MKKIADRLTVIIAILAGIASVGGLAVPGLYRDPDLYKSGWLANDAITALLVPALLLAHHRYRGGSMRAHLLWLGLLLYMFYNYAFYLFGAVFNWFFLIYVALFALSLYALLLALLIVSREGTIRKFDKIAHRKWIAVFLLLVALPLAAVEIGQCIRFIFLGKEPDMPTLILALDLTLVVPNTIVAAVLLWRNSPWAVILSAMMLVKSFTYGAVLLTGSLFIAGKGLAPLDALFPFYVFVSVGGFLFLRLLLKDLQSPIVSKF